MAKNLQCLYLAVATNQTVQLCGCGIAIAVNGFRFDLMCILYVCIVARMFSIHI